MTTLRTFALCALCALAFGCGGGTPEATPPAAETPATDRLDRRADLLAECPAAFEDADPYGHDFCAATVERWVAGELTDEEFFQALGKLRPLPLPLPSELTTERQKAKTGE